MKTTNKLYTIFTYLFFLYPPFIWGLVAIYDVTLDSKEHIATLIVNSLLIVFLGVGFLLAIRFKKIKRPTLIEQKYLLFGLIGNIIVYFYTFQNLLNIDHIVNIYLVLLLVLFVHFMLISHTVKAKELWILLPLFLVIDYIHYAISGCAWMAYRCHDVGLFETIVAVFMYYVFVLAIYIYYIKEMIQYRVFRGFRVINSIIASIIVAMVLFVEDMPDTVERIMLTFIITFAFLLIVDFIVSIVTKQYNHKILIYYLRLVTLIVVALVLGTANIVVHPELTQDVLPIMVIATYVSLGVNILMVILGVKGDSILKQSANVTFTREETDQSSHLYMTINDHAVGHLEYQTHTYEDGKLKQVSVFIVEVPQDIDGVSILIQRLENEFDKDTVICFESVVFDEAIHQIFDKRGYAYLYDDHTKDILYIKK